MFSLCSQELAVMMIIWKKIREVFQSILDYSYYYGFRKIAWFGKNVREKAVRVISYKKPDRHKPKVEESRSNSLCSGFISFTRSFV